MMKTARKSAIGLLVLLAMAVFPAHIFAAGTITLNGVNYGQYASFDPTGSPTSSEVFAGGKKFYATFESGTYRFSASGTTWLAIRDATTGAFVYSPAFIGAGGSYSDVTLNGAYYVHYYYPTPPSVAIIDFL